MDQQSAKLVVRQNYVGVPTCALLTGPVRRTTFHNGVISAVGEYSHARTNVFLSPVVCHTG